MFSSLTRELCLCRSEGQHAVFKILSDVKSYFIHPQRFLLFYETNQIITFRLHFLIIDQIKIAFVKYDINQSNH